MLCGVAASSTVRGQPSAWSAHSRSRCGALRGGLRGLRVVLRGRRDVADVLGAERVGQDVGHGGAADLGAVAAGEDERHTGRKKLAQELAARAAARAAVAGRHRDRLEAAVARAH